MITFYRLSLALTLVLSSYAYSASEEDAANLFKTYCSACHVTQGIGSLAPPLFGVVRRVKLVYPNKEDFVEYIVNWVPAPDASKALMPGAVQKFGVMPALPYPKEDLRLIADYIYSHSGTMPSGGQPFNQPRRGMMMQRQPAN